VGAATWLAKASRHVRIGKTMALKL
jgi:hypothetical protein